MILKLLLQLISITLCQASMLKEPKYRVHYLDNSIPDSLSKSLVANDNATLPGAFEILNVNGEIEDLYLCYVPFYSKIEEDEVNNNSSHLNDDRIKSAAISKISSTFSTKHCIYFNTLSTGSYWTFGYCFGDKIIQFHEDLSHYIATKEHKAEYPDYVYVLGRFNGSEDSETSFENQSKWNQSMLRVEEFEMADDSTDTISITKGKPSHSQKMLKHTLQGGSICDLTGAPRSIDVIYKCDPQYRDVVMLINFVEIKTCQYQMVLNIPRLCQIDEFEPTDKRDEIIDIDCRLIIQEDSAIDDKSINSNVFFNYDELFEEPTDESYFDFYDKITVSDFHLSPLGNSFYVGEKKWESEDDKKVIFLYSGLNNSLDNIASKLGGSFAAALGKKIVSPAAGDEFTPLSWDDTFILWVELYDYLGNFIGITRFERNGKDEEHSLVIQIVNIETMYDHEGFDVTLPSNKREYNGWRYEKFSKGEPLINILQHQPEREETVKSSTVTVTVTEREIDSKPSEINSNYVEQSDVNENDIKLDHDEL